MLSDEEKKAIKNIKKEFEKNHILPDIANEDLGTLLNLIEKQSKEIEELKNTETYKIAIIDKYKYISKDKIKAKIEIRKEEKENCKDSIEEKYLIKDIPVVEQSVGTSSVIRPASLGLSYRRK